MHARRVNTLKSYRTHFSKWKALRERSEEVKPLPAEYKYVGGCLLDLVKQGEMFNACNMPWFVKSISISQF